MENNFIYNNVRRVADERGVSLQQLSDRLGITYQSLHSRLTRNPSISSLMEAANVLQVDFRVFLGMDTRTHSTISSDFICPCCGEKLRIVPVKKK